MNDYVCRGVVGARVQLPVRAGVVVRARPRVLHAPAGGARAAGGAAGGARPPRHARQAR